MAKNKHHTVPKRRKREGKTDYNKRLTLLKSKFSRIVIRRSSKNMIVQIIEYHAEGDKVLAAVSSKDLKKLNWNSHPGNLPSAYLLGLLMAKKAKDLKITKANIDLGLHRANKSSSLFACCKGIEDGEIIIGQSKEIYPSEERISGKHISDYANIIKDNKSQFSKYKTDNVKIEDIATHFNKTKEKIMGQNDKSR